MNFKIIVLFGEFPKLCGYRFEGAHNKDYSSWGSISGTAIYGNFHIKYKVVTSPTCLAEAVWKGLAPAYFPHVAWLLPDPTSLSFRIERLKVRVLMTQHDESSFCHLKPQITVAIQILHDPTILLQ